MKEIEKQLMQLVGEKARSCHLTQRQVAKEIGVSLPTVKRWWSGKGVSMSVLQQLCALLGITLSQLLFEAEERQPSYSYTPEQEKALAANPKALALFDLLVSGETVASIERKFGVRESTMTALLLKLDKIGLIELHPGNKVKLKKRGEPQWIPGGLLSTTYRKKMIEGLLGQHEKEHTTFFIHNYLPEDVVLLEGKFKELENLLLACNARGIRRPDGASSFGIYFCLKHFEWSLRSELSKAR